MLQFVMRNEKSKKLYSISKETDNYTREFGLSLENNAVINKTVKEKPRPKAREETWSQNCLYSQFLLQIKDSYGDQFATHCWLRISKVNSETEGFILNVHDQGMLTRNYKGNIFLNSTDPKCRFCDQ